MIESEKSKSKFFCCSLFAPFFKEPLIKITCAFIAVVGGTAIGTLYQHKSSEEQNYLLMIENDRKQAEHIFNEVSNLMDDRLYKTRRLLSAYVQDDNEKVEYSKQSLVSQLEIWNANLGRMYTLIEEYYGVKFRNFFKNRIQDPFTDTGNHIIYEGAKTVQEQNKIRSTLKQIEADIDVFDKMMLNAIINNRVGRFSEDRDKN